MSTFGHWLNITQLCGLHRIYTILNKLNRSKGDLQNDYLGLKTYSSAVTQYTLSKLDVSSLELRRLHIDLIMCYKIVFGLIDVKFDYFFQLSTVVTIRGHPFKLFQKYSDVNARKSFLETHY